MVIILDLEVIKPADQMAGKIGDPTPYVEGEYTQPDLIRSIAAGGRIHALQHYGVLHH